MLRVAARIILCWTIVVSVGLGYAAEYDRWFGPDEKAEEQQLLFTGQKVDCTLTISEPMWRWWVCVDGVNELKIIRGVEFDITIQWIPLSECVPGDGSARYRYAEYVYSNYPAFEHIGFGDGPDYLHFFWKSANYWDVVLDEIPPCHLHPTSGGVSRRYCGESSTNALVWVVPDHEGTVTRHVHLRIAEPWRSGTDCEPIEAIPELKVRAEYVHTYDGDLPYIKWGGEIGIGISSGFPPAVSVGTTFKVGNNRAWIKHAPYEHGTISEQLLPDDGYFCQIGAKNYKPEHCTGENCECEMYACDPAFVQRDRRDWRRMFIIRHGRAPEPGEVPEESWGIGSVGKWWRVRAEGIRAAVGVEEQRDGVVVSRVLSPGGW